jgi:hypothetical protein
MRLMGLGFLVKDSRLFPDDPSFASKNRIDANFENKIFLTGFFRVICLAT